jgi:hypothetical protein
MRLAHKKGEGKKMTKKNLLLVSLLLVFGLAAAVPAAYASAGTIWAGTNNTIKYIRYEGAAEGVGTITLNTTSTGTIKAGSYFLITYNAPIANTGTEYKSGPRYAVGVACSGDYATTVCGDITYPPVVAAPVVLTAPFSSAPPVPVQGTPKFNAVQLTFLKDIYLPTPLTSAGTSIEIAVRVNVEGYPFGYEVAATVYAYYVYSNYPMTIGPLYPAPYYVAQIGPMQALAIVFKEGPPLVLTCIGVKDIDYYDNDFSLRVTENWANALTSYSDDYNYENDTIVPAPSGGSNILVTLDAIPPLVGIATKTPYSCAEYPSGPHGCPGGALVLSYGGNSGLVASTSFPGEYMEQFYYVVESTNTAVIEDFVLDYKLWSKGPLPPNKNYSIVMTLSLTDDFPSNAPSEMPNFSIPENPQELEVVDFTDCVTKLLFPYINIYQGSLAVPFAHFGTGIDIANTTWDPWNPKYDTENQYPDEHKGSAVPQNGSCTFYFFPADETQSYVVSTPTISAGGSWAFDVAYTLATQIPGFKSFGFGGGGTTPGTGYAIAVCGFQNAYGFAEIYDNYGGVVGTGSPGATLGYLAYILPNPAFYHRSPAGDALGEEAIAPINVNRMILRLLMYDKP